MKSDVSVDNSFDLLYYIKLLLHSIWLIIICTFCAAAITYVISRQITPIYQATTTIMVNLPASSKTSDFNTITMNERLAITYSQMMVSREVLEKVASQLELNLSPGELQKLIKVTPINDTQLVSIVTENPVPEIATEIANTTVDIFAKEIINEQTSRASTLALELQNQLNSIEQKITNLQDELQKENTLTQDQITKSLDEIIASLQTQVVQTQQELVQLEYNFPSMKAYDASGRAIVVTATPNVDQRKQMVTMQEQLENQKSLLDKYQSEYVSLSSGGQTTSLGNSKIDRIQSTITLYQGVYTTLMQNYETIHQSDSQYIGSVTQVDRATIPIKPTRPNIYLFTLVGGFLGFFVSTGGTIVFDTLDDRIKDPNSITERFKLPILSYIYNIPGKSKLVSDDGALHTQAAESFRILRTNLLHTRDNNPPQIVLVTSPTPNDGKTTVAINLATVYAQSGLRVTLLDGDMRKPQLHQMVNALNDYGLSDLILHPNQDSIDRATLPMNGFHMISAGPIPDNPSELLDSGQMRIILEKLLKQADIVIIDSPPVLSVPDALILSTFVEGVVLVIKPETTNMNVLKRTLEQLNRVDAPILGIVVNNIHPARGITYYKNYYAYEASRKHAPSNKRSLRSLFRYLGFLKSDNHGGMKEQQITYSKQK